MKILSLLFSGIKILKINGRYIYYIFLSNQSDLIFFNLNLGILLQILAL